MAVRGRRGRRGLDGVLEKKAFDGVRLRVETSGMASLGRAVWLFSSSSLPSWSSLAVKVAESSEGGDIGVPERVHAKA